MVASLGGTKDDREVTSQGSASGDYRSAKNSIKVGKGGHGYRGRGGLGWYRSRA